MVIIHLDCLLPNSSSDLPENADSLSQIFERATQNRFPGLAPRGVYPAAPVTRYADALLPHRFTHHPFRLFYFLLHLSSLEFQRPDVIRLAALRCSDFPLLLKSDYLTCF